MTTISIILVTVLIAILFVACAIAFERKDWNYGRCPHCGEHWKSFDMDSQGGRGYYSPNAIIRFG